MRDARRTKRGGHRDGVVAIRVRCACCTPDGSARYAGIAINRRRDGDDDACGDDSRDRSRGRTSCAGGCRRAPRRRRRRPPRRAGRPCGRPSRCRPRCTAAERAADDRARALVTVRRHRAAGATADRAADHRAGAAANRAADCRAGNPAERAAEGVVQIVSCCRQRGRASKSGDDEGGGDLLPHARIVPCSQSDYRGFALYVDLIRPASPRALCRGRDECISKSLRRRIAPLSDACREDSGNKLCELRKDLPNTLQPALKPAVARVCGCYRYAPAPWNRRPPRRADATGGRSYRTRQVGKGQ